MIKNIEQSKVIELKNEVTYQKGQVVSKTINKSKCSNVTIFAFDEGESLSAHTSTGDALVTVLDGEASITIDQETFQLKTGESILMPANILHALNAKKSFKMLLLITFGDE